MSPSTQHSQFHGLPDQPTIHHQVELNLDEAWWRLRCLEPQIELSLTRMLFDQPIALSSAISEIKTCIDYPIYLKGILEHFGVDSPAGVEQAVYSWAMKRAQIWIFDLI